MLNHIQRYWGIFTHIEASLRYIQTYSGIFSTLCNHRIFTTLPYSNLIKTLWNVDQAYSELCHRALFSHIHNLAQRLHMQKLVYLESWNSQNSSIIASQLLFISLPCLQEFANIQNPEIFKARHIFRTLSKIQNWVFCKNTLKLQLFFQSASS